MADEKQLRVRVRYDETPERERRVEVLDAHGSVLGDLAGSVAEVRIRATGRDLVILSIDIACERAAIDSIEVPGYNTPRS